MAYDEYQAERISQYFDAKKVNYYTKRMFGGICYMVEDKMCVGAMFHKKSNQDFLMIRIGQEAYEANIDHLGFQPMDFTGRPMKGYAFVTPEGYDSDEDLQFCLDLALAFNPLAPLHKKKRKKS